jgi:hypothetical protein
MRRTERDDKLEFMKRIVDVAKVSGSTSGS